MFTDHYADQQGKYPNTRRHIQVTPNTRTVERIILMKLPQRTHTVLRVSHWLTDKNFSEESLRRDWKAAWPEHLSLSLTSLGIISCCWRNDLEFESSGCSSRGSEYNFQQPLGGTQPSIIRAGALFWPQVYMQAEHYTSVMTLTNRSR